MKKIITYKGKYIENKVLLCTVLSSLVSLPYIFIIYFHDILGIRDLWGFHRAFHVINYLDFGFTKRALVGTFIKPLNTYTNIDFDILILLTYIILLFIFCYLFWSLCIKSGAPRLVQTALILTPATFQFIGFDSPRSSELVWLILFSCWCLYINRLTYIDYRNSFITGLIVSLSLLSYEGSFILIFPSIFLVIISKLGRRIMLNKLLIISFMLVPVITVLLSLHYHGQFENGSIVIRQLLDKVDITIEDTLSEVVVNDLIRSNLSLIKNNDVNWFSNNPIFILYILTWIYANYVELKNTTNLKFNLLLTSFSFSGILLCLVAVDYSRYIALSLIVNIMVLCLIKKDFNWSKNKVWQIISLFAIMGPVGCAGSINPFPLWKFIFDLF